MCAVAIYILLTPVLNIRKPQTYPPTRDGETYVENCTKQKGNNQGVSRILDLLRSYGTPQGSRPTGVKTSSYIGDASERIIATSAKDEAQQITFKWCTAGEEAWRQLPNIMKRKPKEKEKEKEKKRKESVRRVREFWIMSTRTYKKP